MKKLNLDSKIQNSKLNIPKNFLYFLIAPLLILLTGVILLCTIGFNLGTDFTGYSVVKVYVNNELEIVDETVSSYDLNDKKDYNKVYNKITDALSGQDVKITSYTISSMNIIDENFIVSNGQAVEIKYQHNTNNLELIEVADNTIRQNLIAEFSYQNYDQAVSSADFVEPATNLGWTIAIVASIVFAFIVSAIYMSFRYSPTASLVMLMQLALDLFLVIALLTICRLTINFSMGIILLATFAFSLFNIIYFYMKTKDNLKSEKHGKVGLSMLANVTTKEMIYKKMLIYGLVLIATILFIAVAVEGVRQVALGLLIALVVTFYTSTFILPSFWVTLFKDKKKQNLNKNKNSQ